VDLRLSPDHVQVRDMIRELATTEFGPHAARWDQEKELPIAALAQLAELGFFGLLVPEEHGGVGLGLLDAAVAAQPRPGTTFVLQLGPLPPQAGAALFAFGTDMASWNGLPLPAELGNVGLPGCTLWLAPVPGAARLIGAAGGSASLPVPIPADPSLAGLVAVAQALVIDAGAANGLGAVSNSIVLRLY